MTDKINKEKNFISAVVYVRNAEGIVGDFLKKVIGLLDQNFEHSEIICVNDSSEDDSVAVIKEAAKNAHGTGTSVSLINMSYFHGLELSMNAGVDMAIGDYVFEFDTVAMDYEDSTVMEIYKKALTGYDIVSASPDKKEKLSSHVFYKVFERYAEEKYHMTTETFRILSRRVINRIGNMNKTVVYRKALYANSGLSTATVKYAPVPASAVKQDKKERKYRSALALDSLILFTKLGYRFSTAMTAVMILISILMGVYTVATYFTKNPVEGWTTTIFFLSVSFFGLFGILTIIIKYLELLLDMAYKRKHYSFESIEKLTN